MTAKTKFSHKILSFILCLTLILSYVPAFSLESYAAPSDITRVSDPSTLDGWQEFFPIGDVINTENAGGIWTDKSVFTDTSVFSGITQASPESFLVALSAMGANMTVTGMSNVPTDTILILDISGSMNDNEGNNNVAKELVDAANATVTALLGANSYNRVGVVMFSGSSVANNGSSGTNDAVTVLPLGRYTGNSGEFFTYTSVKEWERDGRDWVEVTTESISLSPNVTIEGSNSKPTALSKEVVGGTYTQAGINLARDMFTETSNQTTVTDAVLGTIKRKPVTVLLSDGAPTFATTDFKVTGASDLGTGIGSSAAIGFVTQLTASYAKYAIDKKYGNESLFYTLGVGLSKISETTDKAIAKYVLNPTEDDKSTSANAIRGFWTSYISAETAAGEEIVLETDNRDRPTSTVVKSDEALSQYFVDRHFDTANYGSNLQEAIGEAFKDIVDDIQLQSKYFPTLTEADENLSGYVTFVDKIGKYMEVVSVDGIVMGDTLFSGIDLASRVMKGELGTAASATPLGTEMVNAVMARIGTPDYDTARTLVAMAIDNRQIYHNTSTGEFSNYIGWFADENGSYAGFWYDGIAQATVPANAKYIVKSYGYLGETDAVSGVENSDMMYADVQVRTEIQTGEQTVTFAMPAALIPTVTYEVTLNESNVLTNLKSTGATAPVRMLYQVALKPEINKFTVNEYVDAEYLAANTNADGSVNFYTNRYEVDNSTGYDPVTGTLKNNTYSYFRPSRQNDRYYYQQDAQIYSDAFGTLYTGDTRPDGEKYHAYTVYSKNGTSLSANTVFHRLTSETLDTAEKQGDNWYVPSGDVRRDYYGFVKNKTPDNVTGTLTFSGAPFTDIYGHSVSDTGHRFVVGTTMGNNGKLTLKRETGVKISKSMAAGLAVTDQSFEFVVTNSSDSTDNSTYPAMKTDALGNETETTVTFVNGVASVMLKAGESLYIGGMTDSITVEIKESQTEQYVTQTVNGVVSDNTSVEVKEFTMGEASFVNTVRGSGNLIIGKTVEHPFGGDYIIPADKNSFDITVRLTLDGDPLANRSYNSGAITTDTDGKFTLTLKHDDRVTVYGLPQGTRATVTENTPSYGFTDSYTDSDGTNDGVVTVIADATASVIVVNKYQPDSVSPDIKISGTKNLLGDAYSGTFTFRVQRGTYNSGTATWTWQDKGSAQTVTYTASNGKQTFDFGNVLAGEVYTEEGMYFYRVIEDQFADSNITFDTALHSFTVNVTDKDMDGKLEIDAANGVTTSTSATVDVTSVIAGSWQVNADFENTHSNDSVASVTVDVEKSVLNPSGSVVGQSLSGFEFKLHDDAENTDTVLATNDRGTIRFTLNYNVADLGGLASATRTYTLTEVSGTDEAWLYDTKTVTVTVALSLDSSNNIVAEITDVNGGTYAGTAANAQFQNTYAPKQAQLEIDFVSKNLQGRAPNANEFKFVLTPEAGTALIDKDGNAITEITGTNGADGKVTFAQPLYFDKVGTYVYDISEASGTVSGVSYDTSVYEVVVTVTDVNGVLTATYAVQGSATGTVVFNNTYTPAPVKNALDGIKKLTGRHLLNDEFTFVLTEAVDENGTALTGGTVLTAKNAGPVSNSSEGKFVFPEIQYTKAGTYWYTVHEKGADSTAATYGVSYDSTVYTVKVVIGDDLNGNLFVESETVVNGTELIFTNKYEAKPTVASIPGNKVLEGRVLNDGEFEFTLIASDSSWARKGDIETVTNGADGSFEFTAIDFTKAGEYFYLVEEVQGNKGGVIYDTAVYRVKVVVTDDLLGNLNASVFVYSTSNIPVAGVEFVNKYAAQGSEIVTVNGTKTLNGRDIIDSEFVFELYESGSTTPITAVNNGNNFSFVLTYTQDDIGVHEYTVKEADNGLPGVSYDGTEYSLTVTVSDDGNGGITVEKTLKKGETTVSSADFVNTFADTASVTVDISKTVETAGTQPVSLKGYEFVLENDETKAGQTATTDAEGKAQFVLNYDQNDIGKTFKFTVYEAAGALDYIEYSTAKYAVEVKVELNGDKRLVATVTVDGTPAATASLAFVNKYTPDPVPVVIQGEKTLEGRTLLENEFEFSVYENLSGEKGKLIQTVTNGADGKFAFDAISYDKAGVYEYIVTEELGTRPGVGYSDKEFAVTVTVTDDAQGTLTATTEIEGAEYISFKNTYTVGVSAPVVISGNKTLEGRDLQQGEFAFTLIKADDSWNEIEEIETVVNGADGAFEFDALTYTEADTYNYLVKEVNGSKGGVSYDETVYRIKVFVTDNLLGELNTKLVVYDVNNMEKGGVEFVNKYDTDNQESVVISGNKTLEGRDLQNGEFSFVLIESDKDWAEVKEIETVVNGTDGVFEFDALTYTEAGTYNYLVKEVKGDKGGVSYDETVYRIKIFVTDNLNGKIEAEYKVYDINDNEKAGVEFVNKYATDNQETVVISGTKTLEGRDLQQGEFGFTLIKADDSWNELEEIETVVNGADGAFEFDTLAYTEADTYNYLVKEVKGDKGGVSYDETVYRIKVFVTDNLNGKLEAEIKVYDMADAEKAGVAFVNKYAAKGEHTVTVSGIKTLNGRQMTDGEFSFGAFLDGEQDASVTVTNKDGRFEFVFSYTEEHIGTLQRYIIKEIDNGVHGVSYDGTEYTLDISVTDNGVGGINVDSVLKKGDQTVEAVEFVNTFADTAAVEIEINKTVINIGEAEMSPEGFEFALTETESGEMLKVISDINGLGRFVLNFDQSDLGKTYKYTVTEIDTEKDYVTYSTAKYEVEVTVGLNDEGKLTATVKLDGVETAKASAEFVNEYFYNPPGTPQLGDETNLYLWLALLFVSGGGLVVNAMYRRKAKEIE